MPWFLAFPAKPGASVDLSDKRSKSFQLRDRKMALYDTKLQEAALLHIHVDFGSGSRLLTHFYAFLFFADRYSSS